MRIGVDESGKGDYFGPLVIAGVVVAGPEVEGRLTALGVRDSKRLSDRRVAELAGAIRGLCPADVVAVGPARYNELHARMKNLNRLLAWGHARVIENLLSLPEFLDGHRGPTARPHVVSDQFGDPRFIEQALMRQGRTVHLEQRPRAEADVAVAAASILARDDFLRRLDRLSADCGVDLPRGATHVVDAARRLVAAQGSEALGRVAKLHFRTTKQVLSAVQKPLPHR